MICSVEYLRPESILYLPVEFTADVPGEDVPAVVTIRTDAGQIVFTSTLLFTYPAGSPVTTTITVGEDLGVLASLSAASMHIASSGTGVGTWEAEWEDTGITFSFGMLTTNIPTVSVTRIPVPGCDDCDDIEPGPVWPPVSRAHAETHTLGGSDPVSIAPTQVIGTAMVDSDMYLSRLHDVDASGPTTGDALVWDQLDSLWNPGHPTPADGSVTTAKLDPSITIDGGSP